MAVGAETAVMWLSNARHGSRLQESEKSGHASSLRVSKRNAAWPAFLVLSPGKLILSF